MAHTLNGWQRLWVVMVIAGLVGVLALVAQDFPSQESAEHERALRVLRSALWANVERAQERKDQRAELEALRLLNKGAELVRAESYGDLSNSALIAKVAASFPEQAVQAAVSASANQPASVLRELRIRHVLLPLAVWCAASLVLYVFGMAIGWVRRGFQSSASDV